MHTHPQLPAAKSHEHKQTTTKDVPKYHLTVEEHLWGWVQPRGICATLGYGRVYPVYRQGLALAWTRLLVWLQWHIIFRIKQVTALQRGQRARVWTDTGVIDALTVHVVDGWVAVGCGNRARGCILFLNC